ncbi:MAG: hypothetical protein VX051_00750 [Verrucomicrobiota bacterium]|nr:hypothetical protein [Verrucomicrobiota bacterium]
MLIQRILAKPPPSGFLLGSTNILYANIMRENAEAHNGVMTLGQVFNRVSSNP